MAAWLALLAAQVAIAPAAPSGLALFRSVCVDRTLAAEEAGGSPITFAAMPPEARGALAQLNTAYETMDADGGAHRPIALPGGEVYLVVPAADADPDALPAPGCIAVWKSEQLTEARAYRPPYEAHVSWQSTEKDGWLVMRAIPAFAAPAPPRKD